MLALILSFNTGAVLPLMDYLLYPASTTSPSPTPLCRHSTGITSTHQTPFAHHQTMASASQGQSRPTTPILLEIPAEVRQRILRAALVLVQPVTINGDYSKIKAPRSGQLLKTCRKIYGEGIPLLYGENTFIYDNGLTARSPPTINRFGFNMKLIKIVETWITLSPQHTCLLRQHTGLKSLTIHICAPTPFLIGSKEELFEDLLCSVRAQEKSSQGPFLPELRYLNESLRLEAFMFACNGKSYGFPFCRTVSTSP